MHVTIALNTVDLEPCTNSKLREGVVATVRGDAQLCPVIHFATKHAGFMLPLLSTMQ